MAMGAARKLRRVVENVTHVLAAELLCAAAGLDCRHPLRPGRGVARARERVRESVPPHAGDRPPSTDLAVLAASIRDGAFAGIEAAAP
jgi:histidine ammonia-lyase